MCRTSPFFMPFAPRMSPWRSPHSIMMTSLGAPPVRVFMNSLPFASFPTRWNTPILPMSSGSPSPFLRVVTFSSGKSAAPFPSAKTLGLGSSLDCIGSLSSSGRIVDAGVFDGCFAARTGVFEFCEQPHSASSAATAVSLTAVLFMAEVVCPEEGRVCNGCIGRVVSLRIRETVDVPAGESQKRMVYSTLSADSWVVGTNGAP